MTFLRKLLPLDGAGCIDAMRPYIERQFHLFFFLVCAFVDTKHIAYNLR